MSKISRRKALTVFGAAGASLMLGPSFSFASNKTIVCNWDNAFAP